MIKSVKTLKSERRISMIKTATYLINETIKNGGRIWLTTDWHLITFNKETDTISKRSNYDNIVETYSQIPENDLIINLGDLMDAEVEDPFYLDMLKKKIYQK